MARNIAIRTDELFPGRENTACDKTDGNYHCEEHEPE